MLALVQANFSNRSTETSEQHRQKVRTESTEKAESASGISSGKGGGVGCGLSVCWHAGQHLLPPYNKKGCSQPVSRVLYCTRSAASVIYLRWTSPPTSIVLPSGACRPRHSDGPPSDAGIRGLSSSEVHSTTVTSRLVSSCLTFSPLPP